MDAFPNGTRVMTTITDCEGTVIGYSKDSAGKVQKYLVRFDKNWHNFLYGSFGKDWEFPSMLDLIIK